MRPTDTPRRALRAPLFLALIIIAAVLAACGQAGGGADAADFDAQGRSTVVDGAALDEAAVGGEEGASGGGPEPGVPNALPAEQPTL